MVADQNYCGVEDGLWMGLSKATTRQVTGYISNKYEHVESFNHDTGTTISFRWPEDNFISKTKMGDKQESRILVCSDKYYRIFNGCTFLALMALSAMTVVHEQRITCMKSDMILMKQGHEQQMNTLGKELANIKGILPTRNFGILI